MLIGEIEGTVSTDKFTFRAYKDIRKFDFVAVESDQEEDRWILAQVVDVENHPDGKKMADAQVIGYREKGLLKAPRYALQPKSMVYKADQDVISDTLGLTTDGLYMGHLEANPGIDIYLDPEDLYKHMAVLAKTGAGKSYSTAVLVEELLEKEYPVIVLDPHGEYDTLAVENPELTAEEKETYDINGKEYPVALYSTNTEVNPDATPLQFASTDMPVQEIQQLLPTSLTSSQLGVLYTAVKELKNRDTYTLNEVIDTAMEQDTKAKWGLVNQLELLEEQGVFSDTPTPLTELIQDGTATVIDLKGSDPETQEMAAYKLVKDLFQKRKVNEIPPFLMVIEEAHNFIPERGFGKAMSSDILRTVASEGRKFGLGLVVVSQRPARIDKNVLSQCHTQLIMRLTNPNDLKAVGKSFEGVTSDVKSYLKSLPPGTGLILGKEYPIMVDVRSRRTKHGGQMKRVTEAPDTQDTDEDVDTGMETVKVLPTVTPLADVEAETGRELRKAYYPLWRVDGEDGAVFIDAVEGTIKAKQPGLPKAAQDVLHFAAVKQRSIADVQQRLELDDDTLKHALQTLRDHELITVTETADDVLIEAEPTLFDQDPVTEEPDGKQVEAKIPREQAQQQAAQHIGTVHTTTKLYYPYYAGDDFVYDAVKDETV